MMSLPLVSIVITNYNREKTIGKAIESALSQTYPNLEIIISDNCSNDNSHNIISKYTDDIRIKYYRNETNVGMANNFKLCFEERVKGEFLTIVNSDDELIDNNFIAECVVLINKYENVVIIKSDNLVKTLKTSRTISNNVYLEFYEGIDFLKQINFDIDFGWAGILLHTETINKHNVFDTGIIASDYTANFKMLLTGNICFNKNIVYQFNLHKDNEGKVSYSIPQINKVFIELNDFFTQLKTKVNTQDYNFIEHKIKSFYIKYIYQFSYLSNRKEIISICKMLSEFNDTIFKDFQRLLSTKAFRLLYYFPKTGETITKIKKTIIN